MKDTAAPSSGLGQALYTRQATGFVRDIGLGPTIFMAIALMSIPYAIFTGILAPETNPGTNLIATVILCAVMCAIAAIVWGVLAGVMPRSGGDYIFVSRTLNPIVGFVSSFAWNIWVLFSVASVFASVAPSALGGALASIGAATNNPHLLSAATTVSSKGWSFGIGLATMAICVLLVSVKLRVLVRVYVVGFLLSVLGVFVAIGLLLFNSRSDFVAALHGYHATYASVLAHAKAAGYATTASFSWAASFRSTAIAFGFFGFGFIAAYVGGEVRKPTTTPLKSMLVAIGVGAVVLSVLFGLAARTIGTTWLGSAGYLSTFAPQHYPFAAPAGLFFYISLLTHSQVLIVLMSLSLALASIMTGIPSLLLTTRSLFAWSFDRLAPNKVSDVNDRTHTPLVANGITFVLYVIVIAVTVYGPSRVLELAYTALLGQLPTFMLVAISAGMLPWLQRELYASAPIARYKIGGLPLISVAAVPTLAVYGYFLYQYLTNAALGANSSFGLWCIPVFLGAGVVIYAVSWLINSQRGVDLALAFRGLPPE